MEKNKCLPINEKQREPQNERDKSIPPMFSRKKVNVSWASVFGE